MKSILCLTLLFVLVCNCKCQDSTKYNKISFAPTSLADLNLSLSYSRILNKNVELVINPRIKVTYHKPQEFNYFMEFPSYIKWPWAYNRFTVRGGITYSKKSFFLEPLLQYDYGFRNNRWTVIEISPDLIKNLIDRHYHSIGLIGLMGFYIRDENRSEKFYFGLGCHFKQISVDHLAQAGDGVFNPNLPEHRNYSDIGISLHLGYEFGRYF